MPPKVKTVTAIDHDLFNTFFDAPSSIEERDSAMVAVNLNVAGESLEVRAFIAAALFSSILELIERVSQLSKGSGVLLTQNPAGARLLPGIVRDFSHVLGGLELLVQYCAFPTQVVDMDVSHLDLHNAEGGACRTAVPLPILDVTVLAGAELLLTNEWGWEEACSVKESCTIVRLDQYRSMYKLDRLRPPSKTFYYRYLLDNDSRIERKPVALLYNKLRPAFIRLPGPTDLGLCTSKAFEHYASRVWQKIRASLQHRGMKGMVTVDTTPEFLAYVAWQLPGAARVTPCVIIHEGMIVILVLPHLFHDAGTFILQISQTACNTHTRCWVEASR
jgi:hypothetical protein